jgi:SAM-dependent methyltransferase
MSADQPGQGLLKYGQQSSPTPLTAGERAFFRGCREALFDFHREHPRLYKRLFLESASIPRATSHGLEPLVEIGILQHVGLDVHCALRITVFQSLVIITDPFTLREPGRVFPISRDESMFLAAQMRVQAGTQVLDVGTGSGIYALRAAKNGATVVATDVNPKALAYARLNAALNAVSERIDFRLQGSFDGLGTDRFDLVVSDPPIIPTPPGSGFFVHSDGGVKGTGVSRAILEEAPRLLSRSGQIQMLCTTFRSPSAVARQAANDMGCRAAATDLYGAALSLQELADRFQSVKSTDEWRRSLLADGCEHLHYFYLNITQGGAEPKQARVPRFRGAIEGSWQARLRRLFLVYQTAATPSTSRPTPTSSGVTPAHSGGFAV